MMDNLLADYAEYKRRLDAREVLARYGARNCTETTNKDGTTEIVHSCLLDAVEPHHAHADAHPSAWMNIEKGLYVCSAYWSGDLIHLIQKLEGKEHLHEALPIVGEMLSGATRGVLEFQEELDRIFHGHEVAEIEIPTYAASVLNPWLVSHPYMYEERGLDPTSLADLRVGYDPQENRIVIPHFWDGELVGWQKRAIPGPDAGHPDRHWPPTANPHPKYRSTSGFPKSETLYGWDGVLDMGGKKTAIVVESPASVIRAHSLGLLNPRAVATFGSKVSAIQIDLLSDLDRVYVWFDHDNAGYNGARRLAQGLMNRTEVMVIEPADGYDLGDYRDLSEVRSILENASPAALWLADRDMIEKGQP